MQSCSQTILFGSSGAHRRNVKAAAAIKSSETVQMSSGAFDARDQASPATGVNVRALRKRAHFCRTTAKRRHHACNYLLKSVFCGKISGNRTELAEVAAVDMVKRCRRSVSTSERAA